MKWFFFCVLAANVALLAWNWRQNTEDMPVAVMSGGAATPAGPRLVLLHELDTPLSVRRESAKVSAPRPVPAAEPVTPVAEPMVVAEPVAAAAVPSPAASVCVRLGGFESQSVAADVAKAVQQGGGAVRRQGEEAGEITRYWVMLPPVATPAAATPVLERLQRGGIKDFYLIRSGENANAISLGVYSAKESAQRRLQQIRELKLVPRIEEITLPVKRWWVEFDWADNGKTGAWRGRLPREVRNTPALACR